MHSPRKILLLRSFFGICPLYPTPSRPRFPHSALRCVTVPIQSRPGVEPGDPLGLNLFESFTRAALRFVETPFVNDHLSPGRGRDFFLRAQTIPFPPRSGDFLSAFFPEKAPFTQEDYSDAARPSPPQGLRRPARPLHHQSGTFFSDGCGPSFWRFPAGRRSPNLSSWPRLPGALGSPPFSGSERFLGASTSRGIFETSASPDDEAFVRFRSENGLRQLFSALAQYPPSAVK